MSSTCFKKRRNRVAAIKARIQTKDTGNMKITISNKLTLSNVPKELYQGLCSRLTLDNPKWLENNKMSRWNGNAPEHLRFKVRQGQRFMIILILVLVFYVYLQSQGNLYSAIKGW